MRAPTRKPNFQMGSSALWIALALCLAVYTLVLFNYKLMGETSRDEGFQRQELLKQAIARYNGPLTNIDEQSGGKSSQNQNIIAPANNVCQEKVTILTAFSSGFEPNAKNLIGSIHHFQTNPKYNIIVYDLGISQEALNDIRTWCDVTIEKFDFSKYPEHVKDLGTFAWKPLLIQDAITRLGHPCVFYLDSGMELRDHIQTILADLDRDGFWFTSTEWKFPNMFSHPAVYAYFNTSQEDFQGKDLWEAQAGSGAGFKAGSLAFDKLLGEWATCAKIQGCISPPGTDRSNSRQDQTALNFIMYRPGGFAEQFTALGGTWTVHVQWQYFAWKEHSLPVEYQNIPLVLFTRRRSGILPYAQYLCTN